MTDERSEGAAKPPALVDVLEKLEQALDGLDVLGMKAAGARLSLVIEELRGIVGDD